MQRRESEGSELVMYFMLRCICAARAAVNLSSIVEFILTAKEVEIPDTRLICYNCVQPRLTHWPILDPQLWTVEIDMSGYSFGTI
jgi:hypothetical protein